MFSVAAVVVCRRTLPALPIQQLLLCPLMSNWHPLLRLYTSTVPRMILGRLSRKLPKMEPSHLVSSKVFVRPITRWCLKRPCVQVLPWPGFDSAARWVGYVTNYGLWWFHCWPWPAPVALSNKMQAEKSEHFVVYPFRTT